MKKRTNAKKKKLRYLCRVMIAASVSAILIISIFIGIMKWQSSFCQTDDTGLDYSAIEIARPAITESLLTVNANSRPGIPLKQINGIVIHYTANPGTDAEANRNYFESRKDCAQKTANKVSSHYIIGLDGKIIQCIPDDEIAYASNDRNSDTLSIECCHPDTSGRFTENTYQALIQLLAYLCDQYELETDSIIRHYDVTGKLCPKYYVEHPKAWKKLKKAVIAYLEDSIIKE